MGTGAERAAAGCGGGTEALFRAISTLAVLGAYIDYMAAEAQPGVRLALVNGTIPGHMLVLLVRGTGEPGAGASVGQR